MSKYKPTIAEKNKGEIIRSEYYKSTGHVFNLIEGKRKMLTASDYCAGCGVHYDDLQKEVNNFYSDIYCDAKAGKFSGLTCNEIIIKKLLE
jgi:hypothetical protein